MGSDLNKVIIKGRLAFDPQVRQMQNWTACSLKVASNQQRSSRNGESCTESAFVDVAVTGKSAEVCAAYLRKGSTVIVEGRLRTEQWQDRNTGQQHSKLIVVGEKIDFLDRAIESNSQARPAASQNQRQAPVSQHEQAPQAEQVYSRSTGNGDQRNGSRRDHTNAGTAQPRANAQNQRRQAPSVEPTFVENPGFGPEISIDDIPF